MNNRQKDLMEKTYRAPLSPQEAALRARLTREYRAAGLDSGEATRRADESVRGLRPGSTPGDYEPSVY